MLSFSGILTFFLPMMQGVSIIIATGWQIVWGRIV